MALSLTTIYHLARPRLPPPECPLNRSTADAIHRPGKPAPTADRAPASGLESTRLSRAVANLARNPAARPRSARRTGRLVRQCRTRSARGRSSQPGTSGALTEHPGPRTEGLEEHCRIRRTSAGASAGNPPPIVGPVTQQRTDPHPSPVYLANLRQPARTPQPARSCPAQLRRRDRVQPRKRAGPGR
ncbi:hypothetical protein D3C81_1250190 [compost metagenome]